MNTTNKTSRASSNASAFLPQRLRQFVQGLAITTSLIAGVASAQAADLDLNIGPVASAQGSLMVAIYDSAANFRNVAVQQQQLAATAGQMSLRFSNLVPGEYAIAIFHDSNGNGKLDTNLLGIPKEGYGFSNLTKSLMGPPTWDDVKFAVPAAGGKLDINLNN